MEERNLDLEARNEDIRDKFHTNVVRFELDQIMQHFDEAIQTINAQFVVADELIESGKVNEWGKYLAVHRLYFWQVLLIFICMN